MAGNFLNQSKFAEMAGVSRAAVGQAIKKGVLDIEDKKINLDSAKAKAYLKRNKSTPKVKQNHSGRIARAKIKKAKQTGNDPVEILTQLIEREGELKNNSDLEPVPEDKYTADVKKIQEQIKRLQIASARDLRQLIPIQEINQLFEKQNSILISHFHPLGQRTAEMIAGVLEVSDPEKILQIEQIITDEQMKSINEFKKTLIEYLDE